MSTVFIDRKTDKVLAAILDHDILCDENVECLRYDHMVDDQVKDYCSFLYKNEKKKIEPIVRDISSPREQSAQKARRDEMLEFIQSNEIVKKLNRYSNTGNPVTVTNEISAYKHALRQLCYPDILMGFHKRGQNIYVVKRGKTKQVLEYWLKINEENTVNVALNDTK